MQGINGHLNDLGFRTNAATAGLGSLGTVLGTLANPMTIAAAAAMALGTALAASVQAAASWQTSMTGVAKTTGMAGPELAALSKELLDLSANMPIAASELASIAQAGGSLGIAKEELAGFTEVAAQMGVGFEMAADKAATSGAKILNAFGQEMNTENLRSLGSVVNAMGDSFAATEPQVLDFLNRASFLNATMGQNIQQVAALGTTLISTGLDAEVAATGIKSALNMLTSETSKKGGMDNWAKLMGVSVDELKEKIATDLNSALIETANQIVAIEDPVERFQAAVAAAGTEGAPAILKLAGQQENYAKALGLTNDEWEKATSLQKTFDAQASTANSQWQIFLNTINMAAVELGTIMLPAISETLTFMSDLVKVSIRVGEELYNIGVKAWDALAPLRELWKYTPSGVASNLEGQIWEGIKDWAGIGTEHAETMAKEISENENLQKAGEEAIKAGQDAGVFAAEDVGAAAGEAAGSEYASAFAKAQKSWIDSNGSYYEAGWGQLGRRYGENGEVLEEGVWGLWSQGESDKAKEKMERTFEYMDKEYKMLITKGGSGYYTSLYSGDTLLGQKDFLGDYAKLDPVLAFEAITGLPAPEEGTAAYFALSDESLKQHQAEMQEALSKETFEIKSLGWSSFSGEYEGAQEIADGFEESLKEIDWESLPGVIESGENLKKVILDSSSSAIAAEPFLGLVDEQISKYQAALVAGVADSAKFVESEMDRLGKLSKDAFSDGFLSESERGTLLGLGPELQLLKATFPAEFEKAGGDAVLAMIKAIEAGDIPGALALIGKEAGEEFAQNLLGAAALVPQSLAELIADPNALKSAAVDQDRFWEGTVLPTIKDNAEDAKKAFDSGQFTTEQIYENYIQPMSQLTDYMPGWVGEINSMFKSGAIDIDDYIYILDGMTKKASDTVEKTNAQTKAVQDQAVGYDNLKKAMEDCSDCAVSEFGQWQEAQDGLFQDSYIGSGGGYLDWKNQQIAAIAETQAAMQAIGGVSVGQQYEMPEAQIKIGADTTSAETAKADLESDIIATKPDMTLGIETQAAMDEVNQLVTYITTANPTMSVQVSVSAYAGEIQAIVADAIRSALA